MWVRHATSTDGYTWRVDAAPALATPDDADAWDATHTETPSVTYSPDAPPIPELLSSDNVSGQQPSVSYSAALGLWEMVYTIDKDEERLAMPSTFNPSMGVWQATSPDLMTWSVDYDAGRDFSWSAEADNEELGLLTGASLITVEEEPRLFYTGWGSGNVPDGLVAPVHSGTEPAVLNLLVATRSSLRSVWSDLQDLVLTHHHPHAMLWIPVRRPTKLHQAADEECDPVVLECFLTTLTDEGTTWLFAVVASR